MGLNQTLIYIHTHTHTHTYTHTHKHTHTHTLLLLLMKYGQKLTLQMDIFPCSGNNFTFIRCICIYQHPTLIYTPLFDVCVFLPTIAAAPVPCVVLFSLIAFLPFSIVVTVSYCCTHI